MTYLLLTTIIGHFVGDYLFQTKYMALEKTKNGIDGALTCLYHTCIYTIAVCLIAQTILNPYFIAMVVLSHYLVVHTGSRNFGLKIANFFQKVAKSINPNLGELAWLDGVPAHDYLMCMNTAQNFAKKKNKQYTRKTTLLKNL